jgi:predicted Fe-S protein YdhL (DUF1289 family)
MYHPPSPCTGVCRIEARSDQNGRQLEGWCEGCRRTLSEIADWPMLTPREKAAVLAQLEKRV